MLLRFIHADWALSKDLPDVVEGEYSMDEALDLNELGYNVYWLPNYPSHYEPTRTVKGSDVDVYQYVYVDLDMKDGKYESKEDFIATVLDSEMPEPTMIVDSGNGVHVYWEVTDLDPMSFLRLQRRLCRRFDTDPAVSKLFQLMRLPGTLNVKKEDEFKECALLSETPSAYDCETLDKVLPRITPDDEVYCTSHYNKTFNIKVDNIVITDDLPPKFTRLMRECKEAKDIFMGNVKDRSKADFHLGHLMYADGFSKDEARAVLMNVSKARERAPVHRYNYANDIVESIWKFEEAPAEVKPMLSKSVRDILIASQNTDGAARFPGHPLIDATDHGFRLSEVLGLIGGAGSGKTTVALNFFRWFAKNNPNYIHLFVSLEQPVQEIAIRWSRMTAHDPGLHDKVHVLGNYNDDGTFRKLSLSQIEEYILHLQTETGQKVGCVVIDHIAVLNTRNEDDDTNEGLISVCERMKAFAIRTNTFLVMQSQTNRSKAGIGDVELDKDAAYGTSYFEFYCDYIVTTWQPLKRIYDRASHMTVNAYKFCKIRHKNVTKDKIQEDQVYAMIYDTNTEQLKPMSDTEVGSYEHWIKQATVLRNKDRKREPSQLNKTTWVKSE